MRKTARGITLVALVTTVVLILIVVGITLLILFIPL